MLETNDSSSCPVVIKQPNSVRNCSCAMQLCDVVLGLCFDGHVERLNIMKLLVGWGRKKIEINVTHLVI
jgi:hypothetical protein